MIVLDDNMLGIWFVPMPPEGDWMGALVRDGEDYKLTYRFRVYQGDQSLQFEESQDAKSWVECCITGLPLAAVLRKIGNVTGTLAEKFGSKVHTVAMEDDGVTGFTERLKAQPWTDWEERKLH